MNYLYDGDRVNKTTCLPVCGETPPAVQDETATVQQGFLSACSTATATLSICAPLHELCHFKPSLLQNQPPSREATLVIKQSFQLACGLRFIRAEFKSSPSGASTYLKDDDSHFRPV